MTRVPCATRRRSLTRRARCAGYLVQDIPEAHFCCGSAGTNLLQPDLARQLGQRKAMNIAGLAPQIIAAGNIGCITQIGQYSDAPIVHTVELLDWAYGGQRPSALETSRSKNCPRRPQPRTALAGRKPQPSSGCTRRPSPTATTSGSGDPRLSTGDIMNEGMQGFLREVAAGIGEQWVDTRRETLARYGEHTLPAPVREPSAVLFPASTEHVRAIVLAANRWRIELYPISTGNNIGLGSGANQRRPGCGGSGIPHEPHPPGQRGNVLRRTRAGRQLSDAP